jgi:uncharacterized protein (DUF924 family)
LALTCQPEPAGTGKEAAVARRDEVLEFWLTTVGPKGWYLADDQVDAEIRRRFLPLWEEARDGGLTDWWATPPGTLAFLIVTDQFARNLFRGDGRAFATDAAARAAARRAIALGQDLKVKEPERVFFYMPFEHSEAVADQDWSVELTAARIDPGTDYLLHARAHREIIHRFGRFPFRNAALGRVSTPGEEAFLKGGGYGAVMRELGG